MRIPRRQTLFLFLLIGLALAVRIVFHVADFRNFSQGQALKFRPRIDENQGSQLDGSADRIFWFIQVRKRLLC